MTFGRSAADSVDQRESVRLAADNAAAFWSAIARARGYERIERPGFVAVNGHGRGNLRVVVLSPDLRSAEVAEIEELVRRRTDGRIVVEDAYGSMDLTRLGLGSRQLPIMIRRPGPPLPPPALTVTRVANSDQLRTVERMVVDGFSLPAFQPYEAGEVFPDAILQQPEADFYLVERDSSPAGGCLTITNGVTRGIYWVTTMPEHRSRGVGRALMNALLGSLTDLPITLSASEQGNPLYESLGFDTIGQSAWWTPGR